MRYAWWLLLPALLLAPASLAGEEKPAPGIDWQTDLAKTMTGLGVVALGLLVYPVWRRIVGSSHG